MRLVFSIKSKTLKTSLLGQPKTTTTKKIMCTCVLFFKIKNQKKKVSLFLKTKKKKSGKFLKENSKISFEAFYYISYKF